MGLPLGLLRVLVSLDNKKDKAKADKKQMKQKKIKIYYTYGTGIPKTTFISFVNLTFSA